MASAPIASVNTSPVAHEPQLGRESLQSANMPQFEQVMNLVQPKVAQQAVKAYEAHTEPRSKTQEASSHSDEKSKVDSSTHVERSADASSEETGATPQAVSMAASEMGESQRARLLRIVSQLSQEDLLSVAEWRGDLSLQAGALDTHLDLTNLPKVEGITTSDMMSLLNGFKQLKLDANQLPSLDGPQVAQWLEAQWEGSKAAAATRFAPINMVAQQQVSQPNAVNPMLMGMEAVARPADVMPALNLLKLSQGQKEGILRQVAQGFKTQRGGTQSVNIRLHPEELGAVRLKVEVQGQEVRLFYSAESAAVSDLISQNLEELKAMLLEKDFNLTEASLFQDQLDQGEHGSAEEDDGSDDRPNLMKRPKSSPKLSPLPGRFRATV